jgi:MerR family transcriptional regulator, light-induced transcriptional regulator
VRHPIGVVAERTGLSPDVIRVWERRYGVVAPARDGAGHRSYSDADVERLRLLARATSGGRGIGQVAELETDELAELVRSDEAERRQVVDGVAHALRAKPGVMESAVVERSLARARDLNRQGLEAELQRAATLLDLSSFLEGVVAPLFLQIGEEWHAGRLTIAQEHLASAVASGLVARLMEAAGATVHPSAPRIVVGTPAGEHHEIGALMVAAEAAAHGWRVIYLGPDVPATEIVGAAREAGAGCVALSVVYGAGVEAELTAVADGLPPSVDLLVGGAASLDLQAAPGVRMLDGLESLRDYLAEAGGGRGPVSSGRAG